MFSVVQFVDTCDEKSSVSVVCRTWLIVRPNGIFCAWPPYTDRYQVAKAAINHANPLQSWKVYAVEKVHYETDDYVKAKKKLEVVERTSDVNSENENSTSRKRRLVRRPVIFDDSSSEEEPRVKTAKGAPPQGSVPFANVYSVNAATEDGTFENNDSITSQKSVQQRAKVISDNSEEDDPQGVSSAKAKRKQKNGKSNKQRLPLPPPPPVSIPYETSYLDDGANEEENAETDIFGEEQDAGVILEDETPQASSTFSDAGMPCSSVNLGGADAKNFSTSSIVSNSHILGLYKKMELVTMQVTNLSQLVQEALKRMDALPTVPQMPSSMNLPLTSMDEVDLAETALKNTETFDATVHFLGSIGGANVGACTRNILSQLLDNKLATKFNMQGKGKKRGFANLRLKDVVQGAVRKNYITCQATNDEIYCVTKNWLKYASDRDGGRDSRRKKSSEN